MYKTSWGWNFVKHTNVDHFKGYIRTIARISFNLFILHCLNLSFSDMTTNNKHNVSIVGFRDS